MSDNDDKNKIIMTSTKILNEYNIYTNLDNVSKICKIIIIGLCLLVFIMLGTFVYKQTRSKNYNYNNNSIKYNKGKVKNMSRLNYLLNKHN